jgi:hypothetical protein
MTTHPRDDILTNLVAAYLDHLETGARAPDLAGLPPEVRAEAEATFEVLAASWGAAAQMTAGAVDRIAAHFGFDRAGTDIDLAGAKLKSIRQRARLTVPQLAERMAAAGAPIAVKDLFGIERSPAHPVPQGLVSTMAAVLDCSVADLETIDRAELDAVRAFLDSDEALAVIRQWASEHDRDDAEVRQQVRPLMLTARYRADDVDTHHLRAILEAVLRSLER